MKASKVRSGVFDLLMGWRASIPLKYRTPPQKAFLEPAATVTSSDYSKTAFTDLLAVMLRVQGFFFPQPPPTQFLKIFPDEGLAMI